MQKGGLPLSKSLRNTSCPFEEVCAGSAGSEALAFACGEPDGSGAPASAGTGAAASIPPRPPSFRADFGHKRGEEDFRRHNVQEAGTVQQPGTFLGGTF